MDEATNELARDDRAAYPPPAESSMNVGMTPGMDASGRIPSDAMTMDTLETDPANLDTMDATDAMDAGRTDETAQIRGNIEDTRSQMSSTIDAIQDRLSPHNLMDKAKETVRDATIGKAQDMASNITDTAKGAGINIMSTIRENPLPAALAGIGLGWLVMKARSSSHASDYRGDYHDTGHRGADYYYGGNGASSAQRSTGQSYSTQSDDQGMVSHAVGSVKDAAGNVADKAGDVADQAKESMSQMADQAQWQAQRARGWLERTWDENPLVVGAAALVAGAIVGLSIPESQQERQMFGEARDNLMQKAQGAAQDTVEKVQAVAHEAGQAAKNEAQDQGLTH